MSGWVNISLKLYRRHKTKQQIGSGLTTTSDQHGHRRHDPRYETEKSRMNSEAKPHLWGCSKLELRGQFILVQFHSGCDAADAHVGRSLL